MSDRPGFSDEHFASLLRLAAEKGRITDAEQAEATQENLRRTAMIRLRISGIPFCEATLT